MKRILFVLAAVLIAVSAFAADDRDVVITSDGTVYSIATQPSEDGLSSSLALSVQAGDKTTHTVVPESTSGVSGSPSLAYDSDSKTLFVVWVRTPKANSSELLVASYKPAGDRWEPATIISSGPMHVSNITIRFTRQLQVQQRDLVTYADSPALVLHAAWWESNFYGGGIPRYAVMALTHGYPSDPYVVDLPDWAPSRDIGDPIAPDFMSHIALLAGPTSNSVDVIFADPHTSNFYRLTLRPIADTRVHITVGVHGPKLGGPKTLSVGNWSGHVGTISSDDGNTIIFTNTTDSKVRWVTFRDGEWRPVQELALSDKVTVSSAMAALAKMAASSD